MFSVANNSTTEDNNMTVKLVYKDSSFITMEQKYKGGKVKITVDNKSGGFAGKEVIWTDKDSANKFYKKRIKDGYSRIA